jgi:hypothetical protein
MHIDMGCIAGLENCQVHRLPYGTIFEEKQGDNQLIVL